MNERLLQFIWQFQYFNKNELKIEQGDELTVIHPGKFNTNQGPDFLDAKIAIGATIWTGQVEMHIKSSDWLKHNHSTDKNYSNVILHVVWQHDAEITYQNSSVLPTLQLSNVVPKLLLSKFRELMVKEAFVACESYLPVLDDIKWVAWKERLAVERLQRKSELVLNLLKEANNHWEETFWWMLARNFGIKTNADIFEKIAKSLSLNILAKHKNQINQLEALLLGQAGLLDGEFEDEYVKLLQREYSFLQKKYQLQQLPVKPYFLRMRPANFPTVRLAQLSMLIYRSSHLFSKIKETNSLQVVNDSLNVTANDYWHYHYLLSEPGEYHPKQLGPQMTDNIIINTIVPVLFAYGLSHKDEAAKDKAIQWLTELSPEKNVITKKWESFEVVATNALESQALIELKNNYCNQRRCLQCSVGNAVLKGKE
jgi:hypothetical protein